MSSIFSFSSGEILRFNVTAPMYLDNLDGQSIDAIVRFQLEEWISSKMEEREKSVREGFRSCPCYGLVQGRAGGSSSFASDRFMCRSIAQAVSQDGDMIHAVLAEEERVADDRELAFTLSTENHPRAGTGVHRNLPALSRVWMTSFYASSRGIYMSLLWQRSPNQAESSSRAAGREEPTRRRRAQRIGRKCISSCDEAHPFFDVARCPCSRTSAAAPLPGASI